MNRIGPNPMRPFGVYRATGCDTAAVPPLALCRRDPLPVIGAARIPLLGSVRHNSFRPAAGSQAAAMRGVSAGADTSCTRAAHRRCKAMARSVSLGEHAGQIIVRGTGDHGAGLRDAGASRGNGLRFDLAPCKGRRGLLRRPLRTLSHCIHGAANPCALLHFLLSPP